ncbi:MAG: hypothetical protein MK080_08740 [Opitutales bacterium]|nr:hypothetical protein [Opitutales bacterium]
MDLIVTALRIEAEPWLNRLELIKHNSSGKLELFLNAEQQTAVLITGTGRIAMATALTQTLAIWPHLVSPDLPDVVINFGLAGFIDTDGTPPKRGTLRLIHRIDEQATGRSFYPDRLVQTDIPESALTTHDQIVTHQTPGAQGWVDMEASAFFQAARRFLPTHHFHCLKLLSDYGSKRLDVGEVRSLVSTAFEPVEAYRAQARKIAPPCPNPLQNSHLQWIELAAHTLRLTQSQSSQLREAVHGALLRNADAVAKRLAQPIQALSSSQPSARNARCARLLDEFHNL